MAHIGTVEFPENKTLGAIVPWSALLKIDDIRALHGVTALHMDWGSMRLYTMGLSGARNTAFYFQEVVKPQKRVIPDVRECPVCRVPTKMFPPASITCPKCRRTFGGC